MRSFRLLSQGVLNLFNTLICRILLYLWSMIFHEIISPVFMMFSFFPAKWGLWRRGEQQWNLMRRPHTPSQEVCSFSQSLLWPHLNWTRPSWRFSTSTRMAPSLINVAKVFFSLFLKIIIIDLYSATICFNIRLLRVLYNSNWTYIHVEYNYTCRLCLEWKLLYSFLAH